MAASFTGRVCGAGAGKAPSPTTMRTRQERASPTTASVKARQWKSGSGPTRKSMSRPDSSAPWRTTVRGQVSSVVTPLTMRATGRRARWSRKCSPLKVTMGSVCPCPSSVGDGRGGAEAGVDPALQRDDEHRLAQHGLLVHLEDLGEPVALGAHGTVSSASSAISKSRPIWTGNPSTLPRSPAPAPAT